MKKLLVRFEAESNSHMLVIDEIDKYLGKIHVDVMYLIWTTDKAVEEDDYLYHWCYKDLLEQYLEE